MIIKTTFPIGNPVDVTKMYTFDENYIPFFSEWNEKTPGEWSLSYNLKPIAGVEIFWEVPGFGKLWVSADNEGKGYADDATIDFRTEAVKTKLYKLDKRMDFISKSNETIDEAIKTRIDGAIELFEDAKQLEGEEYARKLDQCLSEAIWAGEELELDFADKKLYKKPIDERKNMRFGCFYFGNDDMTPKNTAAHDYYLSQLYNFGTVCFFRRRMEQEKGIVDWKSREEAVNFHANKGLEMKAHPLTWWRMNPGFPNWMEKLSFETTKKVVYDQAFETVTRFKDHIKTWDVINEVHDPVWGGADMYLPWEKRYEITELACRVVHDADPDAKRIININRPWGVYKSERQFVADLHPYEYIKEVIDRGIEFEIIGIQLYHGAGEQPIRDLSEISDMLDMFASFGKEIHITEINNPSSFMTVPGKEGHEYIVEGTGTWHRPWDQELQADWYEQVYKIALSKPNLNAITNCDFSDNKAVFWSHGGLLDNNDQPKKAYWRLDELFKSIRS